jgi:hypothetical protein
MKRSLAFVAVLAVSFTVVDAHAAVSPDCRKRAASKASALYNFVAKQFRTCAKNAAAGGSCSSSIRDARVAGKLAKTQVALLKKCTDSDGTGQGFPNGDALVVSVAGAANGEARQISDSVYGRVPSTLSAELRDCAAKITAEVALAGKKTVKDMITCGTAPLCSASLDTLWQVAEARASAECTVSALAALVGGDLSAHMQEMRDGAERAAGALAPSFNPVVSVLDPAPGEIVNPPGIPFPLDVSAFVASFPHAGYINSFEIDGEEATFDETNEDFERTVEVDEPGGANLAIFLKARTTLGTVSTTANVNLNLGSLAPDVVITSPSSGTITNGSSVTVSGQVIGDLSEADILLVGGVATSFNPTTGAFSRSVPLTSDPVQFLEAEVQSIGLGTENTDSIVVLKGTAWPLGLRVPNANFNRLNDSGFNDVESIIQATLDGAFAPSEFIGDEAAGGTICEFSTGTKTVQAEGAGANTAQAQISINTFHVKVCDIDTPLGDCDGTFNANNVTVTAQGNLEGVFVGPEQQLGITINNTSVIYTGTSGGLSGGFFCDFVDAFFVDVEAEFEEALTEAFSDELPPAINEALGGINISGSIGPSLDVDIDALYTSVPEDSQGVTFILDSNITALAPVPDAPVITHTLVPSSPGNPVLGPTIPSSGLTYDLGFCLSDGFVNRAMAAFMRQGMFNQSLTAVPVGGTPITLTTGLVGVIAGNDPAYQADCFNCPVTLVLKPTSAAVARAPEGGEGGTVTLIVPNYRVDVVADDAGTPRTQLTALVTFTLPITLSASGTTINVTTGTLAVNNVKVTNNPIGANEAAFVTAAGNLFPLAAGALGDLFEEITLPSFQGLTVTGRGADYNVSCAAIYMTLS